MQIPCPTMFWWKNSVPQQIIIYCGNFHSDSAKIDSQIRFRSSSCFFNQFIILLFTGNGSPNYEVCLNSLPQKLQYRYLYLHLPRTDICSVDLAAPRSKFGNVWLEECWLCNRSSQLLSCGIIPLAGLKVKSNLYRLEAWEKHLPRWQVLILGDTQFKKIHKEG